MGQQMLTAEWFHLRKHCTDCHEHREAQSLCTFCNKWLCFQCTDMHQHHRAPSSLPLLELGRRPAHNESSRWPGGILQCHFHRQEPLDLFCETCDILSCSSCHLTTHKDHRLVHVGKALREQQWLFENLLVQVEDKRSVLENSAKQIEDRLHGVKIMQRKAENQIKMAKMIMMNELNKRTNLLIEQLEKISNEVKQHLEDQLQGMIELCSQLGHVQNFISWAMSHHRRNPLLFSKELITFQMQRLLESQLHCDIGPAVKIKFNWDASFWTKQISTLGQLTTEGGFQTHSMGVACPSILKPQPLTCTTLPTSLCHRALEQGCGFQACFQSQMCCPHCVNVPRPHFDLLVGHSRGSPGVGDRCHPVRPYPPERSQQHNLFPQLKQLCAMHSEKKQLEQRPHLVRCAQSPIPLQRMQPEGQWDPQSSSTLDAHMQQQDVAQTLQPGPGIQLCSSSSLPPGWLQSTQSNPEFLLQSPHKPQVEQLPSKQIQAAAADHSFTDLDKLLMQPAADHSLADRGRLQVQSAVDHSITDSGSLQMQPAANLGRQQEKEQTCTLQQLSATSEPGTIQVTRAEGHPAEAGQLPLSGSDCRVFASLEMSTPAHGLPGNRPSGPSSLRGRRSGSRNAPAEPVTPPPSLPGAQPTGATHSLATAAGEQGCMAGQDGCAPASERRGMLVGAEEELALVAPTIPTSCGSPSAQRSFPLTCKTEPDNSYECEDNGMKGKERHGKTAHENTGGTGGLQKFPGSSRVPFVRLERLKIQSTTGRLLVSRPLPDGHSDPHPDPELKTGGAVTPEPARSLTNGALHKKTLIAIPISVPYVSLERVTQARLNKMEQTAKVTKGDPSERDCAGKHPPSSPSRSSLEIAAYPEQERPVEQPSLPLPSTQPEPESDPGPESESEPDLESESDLESEPDLELEPDFELHRHPESDPGVDSEPQPESDSESELEQQLESEPFPESEPEVESEPESQPEADSELELGLEPQLESEPYLESEPEQDFEPDPKLDSAPGPLSIPLEHAAGEVEPEHREEAEVMENEDFCAVCLNGGDLLCCDHCPKVFHLACHVPALLSFPAGDWVCSLCRDVQQPEVEYDCENTRLSTDHMVKGVSYGLSACDQRRCEKLTMFISCNILSAPFHEPVSPLARHYYQIIKRPMDLSVIRSKLNKRNPLHYYTPEEFVADVFLMFRNCAKFNYPDSEVAQAGRSLEAFFNSKLMEVFQNKTFVPADDDSDSEEYDELYRAGVAGFPWPDRKEHCHRKRKRRRSPNRRRHHF
ncbi:tripartite motif-containing protein 66-like [Megalops cyprinoides]|uniref:tripartite motif-containing protein 66-like n=1 Tax=Megalops cyprinoides TaxID=118141 RepID=UPI0018652576|nr:tripartite motif-containing protein 66-like [Megalops cyprinoides]